MAMVLVREGLSMLAAVCS